MNRPVLRIFSYLPNPRVWKAQIAGEFCGVTVAVNGAPPAEIGSWLWDFDARPLPEAERTEASPHARTSRRGFSGTLYKTDAFLRAHPFGTVPAAFSPDGTVGIFESNSILRAVGRRGGGLYGRDDYEATRIDSFLDASLVFARETQEYLLSLREMKPELHARMASAYEFYLDGIERALVENRFVAGNELTLADISFAPVADVRKTVTPDIKRCDEASCLLLFDLGEGRNRLGASALTQVYGQCGRQGPDLDDAGLFKAAFVTLQKMLQQGLLLAYHDRSDGGLIISLCEMAFAGRSGLHCDISDLGDDVLAALFSEELGVVLQVAQSQLPRVDELVAQAGLQSICHRIGQPCEDERLRIEHAGETPIDESVVDLHRAWSETTLRLQTLRDNPECARQEFDLIQPRQRPQLFADALRAAKHSLDPHGLLNPGVLIDPEGRDTGAGGVMPG